MSQELISRLELEKSRIRSQMDELESIRKRLEEIGVLDVPEIGWKWRELAQRANEIADTISSHKAEIKRARLLKAQEEGEYAYFEAVSTKTFVPICKYSHKQKTLRAAWLKGLKSMLKIHGNMGELECLRPGWINQK